MSDKEKFWFAFAWGVVVGLTIAFCLVLAFTVR